MSIVMGNFVLGAFPIKAKALNIVHELRQAGFSDSEVSIVTCQEGRSDQSLSEPSPLALEKRDIIAKATWTGALLGVTAGSLGMLAFATISLAGFDPVKHREMLSMLMSGAFAGLLAGGVVGQLIGLGLTERHARDIEYAILSGWTAVKVSTDTRHSEAAAIIDGIDARQRDIVSDDRSEEVATQNELTVAANP